MPFDPNQFSCFPNGVYTVLVTPFCETTGDVDYYDIRVWVREQLKTNIAGLVLHGTTSETPTLTEEEKLCIVLCVVAEYVEFYENNPHESKKFICIGVGTNCTKTTISTAQKYANYCHGVMICMPYYNRPQQQGLYEHFKSISDNIGYKMILLYNVPSRTGVNCFPETVKKIVDNCPNVKGLKDATGNIEQAKKTIDMCKNTQLKVFSGDDKVVIDMINVGALGLISVASNIFPEIFCDIIKECSKPYPNNSKFLYNKYCIAELCDAMFCETNPVPVKRMMKLSKRYSSDLVRLPLVALNETHADYVRIIYEKVRDASLQLV